MNSAVRILCSKCKQFYGSEATQGFCSICFKAEGKKSEQEKKKEDIIMVSEDKKEQLKNEIQAEEIKQPEKPAQVKKDQCWKCQKKVGYLGFSCKCGYIFCGVHRHFSEHNCDYDYKTMEREKLMKDNPLITAKKI